VPWHESVWGRGRGVCGPLCATEPKIDLDALRGELLAGLERAKGEVPTVTLVFKDVTYEQTQSPVFRERLDKALPPSVRKRLGAWNVHFDAAKRREG